RKAVTKADLSPVTVVDFTVQAIVLGLLARRFPDDGFIAEEASDVLRRDGAATAAVVDIVRRALDPAMTDTDVFAAIDLGARGARPAAGGSNGTGMGRTWVLDPVDGTKGLLRGQQFCCALAMLREGRPAAGVLGCPNLPLPGEGGEGGGGVGSGMLVYAADGKGCYARPLTAAADAARRVYVSDVSSAAAARFLEAVEAGHSSHGTAAAVREDVRSAAASVRMDSQCKYALLAMGRGECYLRLPSFGYVESIWDHAAGAVAVTEAGGTVTDSVGRPLDFSLGAKMSREVVGIVATNGRIHEEVRMSFWRC
ncbi:unnamed protein product, partial [Phaeothamnion confervicola]